MQATLETAALAAIEELEPGFRQLAHDGLINGTEIPVDVTTAAALKAYRKQTQEALNMVNTVMQYKAKAAARKLINDTAELANKSEFLAMLNKAAGSMVTGAESRQTALRCCIHKMTEKGIPAFVDKLGREWTPEAYINMDLRTTMSNAAHQVQFDRMDAYGLTLLEVSSHAGARPKCAKDQGKIFNCNGSGGYTTDLHGRKIRYYAWKDSSYGEPDGLLGINCGHHVYPFTPGIDVQRYFPYDEKENDELYQKLQHQRELERRVRRSKRECMALETTGDTEGFAKASVTLKKREQALKQYCADEGLDYKNDRTAVVGYGRSTAAKASAAAKRKLAEQTRKRLDKSAESGIIQEKIRLYNIHNETDVGVFTAEEIESAMQSSPIGRSTMHYIESEGMSIEMNYDLNAPDWLCGSISGRQVSINVQNHSNATEVMETIIHEIAHHRFSWDKTQEDEVNCRIYEYLHTHDTISDTKISEIVSFVKSEYDDFPEGDLYGY